MEYLKLGEISKFIMGQAPNSENCNKNGSGTIFVKAGQFGELYPNIEEWTVTPLKLAKENDVLICVVGATVGKLNLAIDCAIGRSVAAIRCDSKKLHYKYLYYYLNTWITRIRELSQGSAIGVITKDMLYDLNIPMYDISSQIYIVNILDKAQKLMDKRKQQIEALDELVKSKFIEMFGDPITNPKGWNIKKLKEISTKILSGNTPKGGSEVYVDEGIMFFRSQNVWKNKLELKDIAYIDEETNSKMIKSSLKNRDILMTKTGRINTENSSLGRAAMFIGENDSANINGHVYLVRLQKGEINEFVLFILTTNEYRDYIRSVCVGGIDKRQINKEHLEEFPIIYPPIELQNQFANFVKQVDKLKSEMENSLKELEDNFNSLMQKAFKGELFN